MLTHISQRTHKSYPFSHLIRYCFLLLLASSLLVSTLTAQNDKDTPALELGKPIERELAGDAVHSYRIALAANQFLHVVVEQKGIDVVVALFAPDGKKVAEVDSPNGTHGPEPISVVAEATGSYRLEVRSLEAKAEAGRYEAKVEELRAAKPQDKSRIAAQYAAQQAFAEGEQLRGEGSADSLRKAIDKYQEALPLWRTVNDHAKEASTLNYIGFIYSALGEKQKALDFYNQALPLRRAVGDRRGEAYTLNNIGAIYDALGEQQKALDLYNQALLLARSVSDHSGEAYTLNNMGAIYDVLGEKQKSLDLYDQALLLWRAIGDRSGEAETLNNIGGAYDALGEKHRALDFYNQALPLRRAVGDRSGEANTLHNIGFAYNSLGEQQKALDFYNQALPLWRAIGDRRNEAYTLNNIGLIYSALGEQQKALDFYNQALLLARSVSDRRGEAYTLNNIGAIYDALGEQQKALDLYNQALPLWRAIGDRSGEGKVLASIAKVDRDGGNLTGARARIEEALTIVESLRTKIVSQELRSSYFATVQKYYDFYIDLLMRLHQQQPSAGLDGAALQASERGRARSLLEILAEANADIRQGVDPPLVARERSLQQQLNAKAQEQTRLLSGRHTDAQAATIAKEIERLTTEFQQTRAQIRQTSPRYVALTQPQPLTLKEIQTQLLDRDTLLLEYALGDEKSYLWAVTPTSITSYELPKREEIEKAARRFYELITVSPRQASSAAPEKRETGEALQRQDGTQLMQAAVRLSRMLLAPVAPLLGKKRLLIVGDGALQYIPFAALPTPTGGVGRAATKLLIVEHEIVNLPSASTLAVLRREVGGRQPAPKTLAVLADPVFERSDERFKAQVGKTEASDPRSNARADEWLDRSVVVVTSARQSGVADAGLRIRRLPGTRREADEIVKLVPPTNYKKALDFAANRVTATSPDLGQYRYVHFATHGFLNSQHPELSGIVLSMFDEQGAPEDGFLRAHEVFNLKLGADVVVLSACRTGLGKEIRGEGLVGLTRGFMYAGAPRVVVSLWNVNDAATAELMTRFYRGMLVDKRRPAQALQAAQVSMLNERRYSVPFYWAAFTLQGEWR